jgi:hypothetical protein
MITSEIEREKKKRWRESTGGLEGNDERES